MYLNGWGKEIERKNELFTYFSSVLVGCCKELHIRLLLVIYPFIGYHPSIHLITNARFIMTVISWWTRNLLVEKDDELNCLPSIL